MHQKNSAQALSSKSDTPERLRETALELFACKGYQSTSLRDIAANLGLHAGSIYNHVDNKQMLLFDLIECALDDLLNTTRKQLKRAATARAKLNLFFRVFTNFQKSDHRRLLLVCRESFNLTPEQRQYIAVLREKYTHCLSDIINTVHPPSRLPHRDAYSKSSTIVAILLSTPLWDTVTMGSIPDGALMDIFLKSIAST